MGKKVACPPALGRDMWLEWVQPISQLTIVFIEYRLLCPVLWRAHGAGDEGLALTSGCRKETHTYEKNHLIRQEPPQTVSATEKLRGRKGACNGDRKNPFRP